MQCYNYMCTRQELRYALRLHIHQHLLFALLTLLDLSDRLDIWFIWFVQQLKQRQQPNPFLDALRALLIGFHHGQDHPRQGDHIRLVDGQQIVDGGVVALIIRQVEVHLEEECTGEGKLFHFEALLHCHLGLHGEQQLIEVRFQGVGLVCYE